MSMGARTLFTYMLALLDVCRYIAACIAIVFFGSNYVVVKFVKTGDGVMFQVH